MNPTSTSKLTPFQWLALYVAVISAAGSTLCLQLVQTRVLSSLYYNHLVYLTVTVALLGFGISGVVVAIVAPRVGKLEDLAAAGLCASSIFVPFSIAAASYLPALFDSPLILVKLILGYLLLVIPFIFLGLTLASIFMIGGRSMHLLYFIDLAASAMGTIAFVLLLTPLGAEGLLWACSFATLTGFFILSKAFKMNILRPLQVFLLLLVCAVGFKGHLISSIPDFGKFGSKEPFWYSLQVENTRWTTIAKIEVLDHYSFGWKFLPDAPPFRMKMITQDRDAITYISPPALFEARCKSAQSSSPLINGDAISFIAHPNPIDSLIIGVGGGNDIVNALAFGAKNIVGVEINPQTISLMQHEYADYAIWPKAPNVSILCMDGRNYVASTSKKFDTINLSGIDTFAALSTGAYVLSENYLYTVEAMKNYLGALKPNGILCIFRWNFKTPRESLRLCNLFLEAARERGDQHPEKCIMIVGTQFSSNSAYRWTSMVVKNEPFTDQEVHKVLDQIDRQPPLALVYLPKIFPPEEQAALEHKFFKYDPDFYDSSRRIFASLIDAKSQDERTKFEADYPYNITPVYDNRPFFFEYHKMSEIFHNSDPNAFGIRGIYVHYTLYFLLIITSIASYLGMILPLRFFAKEGLTVPSSKALIFFFASLGVGFMFIELGVIQSLNIYLGHPMYSLALVLAGLLFFTGVGSLVSCLRDLPVARLMKEGLLGSSAVILLWILIMPSVISATMGSSIWLRGFLTLLSLFPLGLFMGIPFATGIRYLSDGHSRFIPWAWGINGMTSVMASILAIILAMRIGFKAVLILGALTYLLGFLASRRFIKS